MYFQFAKLSTISFLMFLIIGPDQGHSLVLNQTVITKWGFSSKNTTLDLSVHFLQAIEPSTFDAYSLIEHLALDHNQLSSIDEDVFGKLTTLLTLNFDTNRIARIDSGSFANMAKLKKLAISNNLLSFLDEEVFQGLVSLEVLDLSSNKLYSLSPVSVLENLRELYFNENFVGFMLKGTFENLIRLERLELAHNVINYVDIFPLQYLSKSLIELDLSYNQIEKVPEFLFAEFETIESILLAQNRIWSIGRGAFSGPNDTTNVDDDSSFPLARLKQLDLGFNKLSVLTKGQFSNLPGLRTLVLDNNAIEVVDKLAFYRLDNLRELSLASNRLVSLDPNDLFCLSRLDKLDLCNNRKLVYVNQTVCDSLPLMKDIWVRERLINNCNCSELCPAATTAASSTNKGATTPLRIDVESLLPNVYQWLHSMLGKK